MNKSDVVEENGSTAGAVPRTAGRPTIAEIQEQLDALVVGMLAKGLREPDTRFSIKSQAESYVALTWNSKQGRYADMHEYFYGDAAKVLSEAAAFVAALPSPEQAALKAFMGALDEAIELGKKADIDVEYVNPLLALMKKLSKNALVHQAES